MPNPSTSGLIWAFLLAMSAGCRSGRVEEVRPMSAGQLQAVFSRAQDPRRFWITVYDSEDGAHFANAHRVHPGQRVALPFEGGRREPPLPLLAAEGAGGAAFTALLDTSARYNWAGPAAVLGLGGTPLGPPAYESRPEHVAEPVRGYACVIPTLRHDVLQMENAVFHLRAAHGPLGRLARREEMKNPPGIVLGMSWVSAFAFVQVHYPRRLVFLSSTAPYTPSPDHLVAALPIRNARGALAVEGRVDDRPRTILLDTAGDFELAMDAPPDAPCRLALGDLVLPAVQAEPAGEFGLGMTGYPRAGLRLLSKYRVTIAPKDRLVYIERP